MALTTIPGVGKLRAAILSALITELRPITASKSGTTSRNTTTTPASDPDLAISLPANSVWDFHACLFLTSDANAAGDFLAQWAYPADATVSSGGLALNNALASGSSASLEAAAGALDATTPSALLAVGASTSPTMAVMEGRITLVTAGSLTLQWSQFGSNANNTNLLGGSFVTARRVS